MLERNRHAEEPFHQFYNSSEWGSEMGYGQENLYFERSFYSSIGNLDDASISNTRGRLANVTRDTPSGEYVAVHVSNGELFLYG